MSTEAAGAGGIPQSSALVEAHGDSLAEVMSRDPEGYSRQDRDAIIAALRAQRARQESAEKASPVRAPRGAPKIPLTNKATQNAEDMGL